jgi:hypothetical protein
LWPLPALLGNLAEPGAANPLRLLYCEVVPARLHRQVKENDDDGYRPDDLADRYD